MLHDLLRQYLEEAESSIGTLENVYVKRCQEEILIPGRVNLRIRVRFPEGSLLELSEAIVVETELVTHLGCRCHFQDSENHLVLRYDNTPHFPELHNFRHHKHLENEVTPCEKPTIPKVVEEVGLHFWAASKKLIGHRWSS